MQQGRVHLDADWNEQTSILLRYLQALASDLIGPHGGPLDADGASFTSFKILSLDGVSDDFEIGPGHYYVDGILCELAATFVPVITIPNLNSNQLQVASLRVDGLDLARGQFVEVRTTHAPDPQKSVTAKITDISDDQTLTLDLPSLAQFPGKTKPVLRRVVTFRTQSDYPIPANQAIGTDRSLVYLDVWERHISCSEDDSIREVALGGPDTATRAKIVWQVKIDPEISDCPKEPNAWAGFLDKHQPRNRGRLKARAKQESVSTDPCIILPESSYRGAENQLYRVEIHTGTNFTDNKPTFKWSRDNSSVEFAARTLQPPVVTLAHLWRDSRSALKVDDWVELVDDSMVLLGTGGILMQVESIGDPAEMTVTLKPPGPGLPQPAKYEANDPRHPLLRRWDYQAGKLEAGRAELGADGALLIPTDVPKWIELEDGVQILFVVGSRSQPNQFRAGDYWLIAARTVTGDLKWPVEGEDGNLVPAALPPHGIEHHYAPLGIISGAGGKVNPPLLADDCRKPFKTVVGLTP